MNLNTQHPNVHGTKKHEPTSLGQGFLPGVISLVLGVPLLVALAVTSIQARKKARSR